MGLVFQDDGFGFGFTGWWISVFLDLDLGFSGLRIRSLKDLDQVFFDSAVGCSRIWTQSFNGLDWFFRILVSNGRFSG